MGDEICFQEKRLCQSKCDKRYCIAHIHFVAATTLQTGNTGRGEQLWRFSQYMLFLTCCGIHTKKENLTLTRNYLVNKLEIKILDCSKQKQQFNARCQLKKIHQIS
ncbi:Hypothetical_protein [Hexamita inflata]|uniref:Hypothetical_protein n=1 Tax=Hexamita inflata TaxID=28002 RepID=A0AA86PF83_9EUKA|nr:Hypothetical protein HINF_LOCUS25168 [Hexamita inflata]